MKAGCNETTRLFETSQQPLRFDLRRAVCGVMFFIAHRKLFNSSAELKSPPYPPTYSPLQGLSTALLKTLKNTRE
ncbi:hypothetical protein CesoFtcFv8_020281 [Champsocephalus esox]|uniref:Uncharacterized protein n=1 Tax=Champsocephalus esox TaxID=159716 RepID=A0AAN8BF12_9TELE|nr:hypothetical protein CesoFtcFv8_020281 [Champsocephalus esox]